MFTYPYYGTWPSKTPVHLLEFELCEYKDHIFWIGHDPNDHSKKRIYVISPSGSDLGDELIEPDTITKIKITPHLFGLLKTTTSITEKDISEGWEKRKVKSIILKLTRMFDRWEIEEKERDIECIKNRESYEKIAAAIVDGKV
jgi:hypothetical protein